MTAPARRVRQDWSGRGRPDYSTSPPAGSNKGGSESDRAWFGRATPAARHFYVGTGHAVEAQRFWEQVGVLAQAVAGALDVNDNRMVEQAVQQRGRDNDLVDDQQLRPAQKADALGRRRPSRSALARLSMMSASDEK